MEETVPSTGVRPRRARRRWVVPPGVWGRVIGFALLGWAAGWARAQTYEIRPLVPPPDTFPAGETAALSPVVVNHRGEILLNNASENPTSTRQKGAVMARWSVGPGSALSYRRIVASVPKHPSDLTWQKSALTLVDLADDGTAVGWEEYEGLENATFENAGAERIQQLGLFHDLVMLGPDAAVPRRLGLHTYVRQLWNNVLRTDPVAVAVNARGSFLGRYRIYHRFNGTEFGGDFVGNGAGSVAYLRESPKGGAMDLNDQGHVIGVLPGGVAAIWNPAFKPLPEVIGYSGSGRVQPVKINNLGEVAGQIDEAGNVSKLFLWLPRPSYGLGAGLHTLFTVTNTAVQVFDLNDSGALLWTYGTAPNNNAYLWTERRSLPLRQAVPAGSPWLPVRGGPMSVNDLGWISGWAVSGNGQQVVPMVMRPAADAEALLSTNRVRVGEVFTFRLRLRNHTGTAATLGLPIGFRQAGNAQFELVGSPTPPAPRVVPAQGTLEVRQQIRALAPGSARWFSQGRLISGGTTNDTLPAYAEAVRVLDRADLLVKRGGEPEDRFGINDEYQATPSGSQVRTQSVLAGEAAEFVVRVENDDTRARTFRLRAEEGGESGRWEVRHALGGQDVSADLRSPGGRVLPELAPGASLTLTLRVRGTNAVPGDVQRVVCTVEDAGQPGEIADAVEAVTQMGGEIVVNSTGDERDADPYDQVADVDLAKPGAQTTLRAAIEVANQRSGRDRIGFRITPEGNVFEGGVPVIRPRSGLPVVTEAAEIDGWTQNPASPTPPVVLNGSRLVVEGDLPAPREAWSDWAGNPAAAHGLEFNASDGRVTGLVIQQFPLFGIRFRGEGHVIEGNFIGTDATGSFSRANGVQASLDTGLEGRLVGGGVSGSGSRNRIGGVGARSGNLLGGLSDGYLVLRGADTLLSGPAVELFGDANEVLGNWIGVDRTGDAPLGGLDPSLHRMAAGIVVSGNLNRIGGPGPGEGNVVVAVRSSGISVMGDLNRVQGNRVGLGDSGGSIPVGEGAGPALPMGGQAGIRVQGSANDVGGLAPGEGNLVGHALAGVVVGGMLGGERTRVHGNRIGLAADGRSAASVEGAGIRLEGTEDCEVVSNTVAQVTWGNGVEIVRNGAFDPARTRVEFNRISSVGYGLPGPGPGLGAGILVGAGEGHRLVENEIRDTAFEGIQLYDAANPRPWSNDDGDADGGPNRLQNHPVITRARVLLLQGQRVTEVEGMLRTDPGPVFGDPARYAVEVFFSDRAGPGGSGEAASLLTAQEVPILATGEFAFRWRSSQPVAEPGQWVTATARDPAGNTSMLAPAVLVQGEIDDDADAISDAVEDLVPGASGTPGAAGLASARVPLGTPGDGNGDDVPDARQPGVVSLPSAGGPWLTLVAPSGASWVEVRPAIPPWAGRGPDGVVFPAGWIEGALRGVAPGASVTLTLVLPGAEGLEDVVVWAPASPGAEPEAIGLPSTVEGTRIQAALRDAGPGDRDGVADGVLRLRFGVRRPAAAGPRVRLTGVRPVSVDRPGWERVEGRWQVVSRPVSAVAAELDWPGSAGDWWPEQSADPGAGAGWRWVEGEVSRREDRLVLPHRAAEPMQFYRLRRRP